MGKFKAPFSSQGGQCPSQRADHAVRRQATLSPLRLGRADVITPGTKNKIKQRLAGLAQQPRGLKVTSPGIPVPFDLSQSQSVTSQQFQVAHDVAKDFVTINENVDENGKRTEDVHANHACETDLIPEELFTEFDEEDNALVGNAEGPETETDEDNVANHVGNNEGNRTDIYTDESNKTVHKAEHNRETDTVPSVYQQKKIFKDKKERKHRVVKVAQPNMVFELLDGDDVDVSKRASLNDSTNKVARYLSALPQARDKSKNGKKNLQLKKDVLQTIYKMHEEIESFQRRRTELRKGKDSSYQYALKEKQRRVPTTQATFEE